jgi:hypothetical protein
MPEIPLQFPWQVAEGGYRWVESHPIREPEQVRRPFLTHGRPIGAGGFRVMQYLPLSAFSGLFRVFADTEPNHDGIKAFADRFGPLGGDLVNPILLHDQPTRPRRHWSGTSSAGSCRSVPPPSWCRS